ncbi:MAG: phosphoserine phosphatase RsbU/P [Gaiellales bacterium]|jgi:serine phosphatase RsbU (regulator of sigma subunit)|nr:phosphoserine phosphatase RsbU/P [Gaiellales bacterium]
MPAGEPGRVPTAEDLLALPIDRLPDEIVWIAERLAEAPVGLYVVDLEGVALRRLAGASSFPEEVPIPQMAGPEIPTGHLAALEREFSARGLGTVVPLWLRHRAIALFLVDGTPGAALDDFAARAAAVLELSLRYTDRLAGARHRQRATAGAELQQLLLPPRIAGIRGAEIAGSVLPAYDVGGDWFEHVVDRRGAWLAVADASGKGPRASALSALTLAALRATREAGGSLADAAGEMDRAILGFNDPSMFVTALLARWNYADSTLEWLTFGHPQPCRITASGVLDDLRGAVLPPLGLLAGQPMVLTRAALRPCDRVVFYSDGVIERRSGEGRLGIEGLHAHMRAASEPSAASLLTHILSHVTGAHETPLEDDATVVVLGVLEDQTHEPPAAPPSEGTTRHD